MQRHSFGALLLVRKIEKLSATKRDKLDIMMQIRCKSRAVDSFVYFITESKSLSLFKFLKMLASLDICRPFS